jgi:isocitrate/isopropylmalate dehydrogenase
MILACGAVLRHAADHHGPAAARGARAIYESAFETIAGGVKTPDLGGHAGTTEFTSEVVGRIAAKLEVWSALGSAG